MMSVCSNWPIPSEFIRKYAWIGMSTVVFSGTYTNEPPDQIAPWSAANLLSLGDALRHEVLADDLFVLSDGLVHVTEDDALLLPLLLHVLVDDLRLVLGADAGERVLLGLRNAQLVEGVFDLVGSSVQSSTPARTSTSGRMYGMISSMSTSLRSGCPGQSVGIGISWNCSSARRRRSSIHSGSSLSSEMTRTVSSVSPSRSGRRISPPS